MKSGIYVKSENEKRFLATLDEVVYGSEETRQEIASDLINFVRDEAVNIIDRDEYEEVSKVVLFIVN
jgi:hypothetical protein